MGEMTENVKNFGALNVDLLQKVKKISKIELEKRLNFKLGDKNILVTFHPETLTKISSKQ